MWGTLKQLYQSNVINALIVIIGAILTFLPLYVGEPSNLEDTIISDASDSELFHNASVALLSLVSPLIVDSTFDLLNAWIFVDNRLSKTNAKSTIDDCSFDWKEKVLFILGIIILPINIFLPSTTRNLTLILICSRKCRLVLCTGAVGCSLCRREHIISKPLITACLLLYNISAATGSFAQNTQGIIPPGPRGLALFYANIIFSYVPVIVALALCVWWLLRVALVEVSRRVHAVSNTAIMKNIKSSLGDSCTGDYLAYRVGFIMILLLWGILSATLTVRYKNVGSFDEIGMFLDVLPYILFVLAQTALSMRLVKFEAVQGLVSISFIYEIFNLLN
jgi:hypothetical protein